MPVVNPKPTAPPPEEPHAPIVAAPEYRGVTVDTRYTPNTSLLTHVEGSSWTVEFYSQVLDSDSPLSGQNVTQNAIYQQYRLIKGFELRVSSPLTTSQDETSKALIMTGTANVYPFVIPNEGDMFLADIGDGREGVFKITHSERKSVFKEAIHQIEYQLIDYSTDIRRADLNSKVVQTLHFVRDFLTYGQNPLLESEDFEITRRLETQWSDIVQRYFKSFTSASYRTLLVPSQSHPTYDHFLTTAVMAFFDTYDAPEIRYVRKLNVGGDDIMKGTTLWDALMAKNLAMLKFANRQAGLVGARSFDKNPMLDGIYHSGIAYVVYPVDPDISVDFEMHGIPKQLADQGLQDSPSRVRTLNDLLGDQVFAGLTLPDTPPIHPVTLDNYYVLSQAFYDDTPTGQSMLEVCVRQYLENKALDKRVLLALCDTYHAWGSLERFYYVPILLMLMKASIRGI